MVTANIDCAHRMCVSIRHRVRCWVKASLDGQRYKYTALLPSRTAAHRLESAQCVYAVDVCSVNINRIHGGWLRHILHGMLGIYEYGVGTKRKQAQGDQIGWIFFYLMFNFWGNLFRNKIVTIVRKWSELGLIINYYVELFIFDFPYLSAPPTE